MKSRAALSTVLTLVSSLASCSFESYDIIIENRYFETLKQIRIGDIAVAELAAGERTKPQGIPAGSCKFSALTDSSLHISASLSLQGIDSRILTLIIHRSAQVTLE